MGNVQGSRDASPNHFRIKIESFSVLSSSSLQRYESCAFDAANHKWKLAIYPKGNKAKNGESHISLYLVLADKDAQNTDMVATYSLYVFDHKRNNYLSVQASSRFHAAKLESGFAKFLPLHVFESPFKGYLNNDTCVFGADVFLAESQPKVQCLSLSRYSSNNPYKFGWTIRDFSHPKDEAHYSERFTLGGHNWQIRLFPKGNGQGKGNCVSLYFALPDAATTISPEKEVIVEYEFRIKSHLRHIPSIRHKCTSSFTCSSSCYGWSGFAYLSTLESNRYLVNDTCMIEADVRILGTGSQWN